MIILVILAKTKYINYALTCYLKFGIKHLNITICNKNVNGKHIYLIYIQETSAYLRVHVPWLSLSFKVFSRNWQ